MIATLAITAGVLASTAATSTANPATARTSSGPTFTRDVAPVLFQNCTICHHEGGAGPFSLLDYSGVKKHAQLIAKVTSSRYMPPWLPEPGHGDFAGVRRLTDEQIDLIRRWVEQGAAEGEPSDLPTVPSYRGEWQLGQPDLVLTMPRPYVLQAAGRDVFRNFVFSVPLKSSRYVSAVEILPGSERAVHHANIFIDRSGSARRLEGYEPQPGFPGMRVKLESKRFEPQSHFLFWKPGTAMARDPDDISWRLDKGTDLVLNVHMRPSGKPETVQPSIGLYFCEGPPTKFPMLLQLEHDGDLDIPPHKKDFVVTDELVMPLDVDLLGVYPHAHYLGRDVQGTAILPSGEKKSLIWIKEWSLDWQAVYRYATPLPLPKGTKVSMRWTYDNTDGNERNPNHPPKRVTYGPDSSDEMSHLWIQVLPHSEEDRKILQEALVRRKLKKYPRDFDAHLSLGVVLQAMGRLDEALVPYREAVSLKPGDATAENNLGAALLIAEAAKPAAAGGSRPSPAVLDEAVRHFRQSLANRPDYVDARYNLAKALLAQGRADEAIGHLREVVQQTPDDPSAHAHLGMALMEKGEIAEAEAVLDAAVRLDPDNATTRYNLGYLQARRGQLDPAIENLEKALRLDPRAVDVHIVLGSLYASQGKLPRAIQLFESAVRLDPGNAMAREKLDRARAEMGAAKE